MPDGIRAVARTARYERHDGSTGHVEGFELVTPDGRWLPDYRCGVSKWASLGLFHLKVVGESHRTQAELREAVAGHPAYFVPEPNNPYDPKAIGVRTHSGALVGYVPRDETDRVRKLFATAKAPVHAAFWCVHRDGRSGAVVAVETLLWQAGRLDGPGVPPHAPVR